MKGEIMYIPKPVDTSEIQLPDNLVALTEEIAENVHEVWAQGRIEDGWTYGEKRDDENKKHHVLCHIRNSAILKKNMTVTQQLKPLSL